MYKKIILTDNEKQMLLKYHEMACSVDPETRKLCFDMFKQDHLYKKYHNSIIHWEMPTFKPSNYPYSIFDYKIKEAYYDYNYFVAINYRSSIYLELVDEITFIFKWYDEK